jgi:hypothetical protein
MRFQARVHRTESNPLAGVVFDSGEEQQIRNIAEVLARLDDDTRVAIRWSTARELLRLAELADWTQGQAEQFRADRERICALTYQATREASVLIAAGFQRQAYPNGVE